MSEPLQPGLTRTERVTIDRDRTIGFMGEGARVPGQKGAGLFCRT